MKKLFFITLLFLVCSPSLFSQKNNYGFYLRGGYSALNGYAGVEWLGKGGGIGLGYYNGLLLDGTIFLSWNKATGAYIGVSGNLSDSVSEGYQYFYCLGYRFCKPESLIDFKAGLGLFENTSLGIDVTIGLRIF